MIVSGAGLPAPAWIPTITMALLTTVAAGGWSSGGRLVDLIAISRLVTVVLVGWTGIALVLRRFGDVRVVVLPFVAAGRVDCWLNISVS